MTTETKNLIAVPIGIPYRNEWQRIIDNSGYFFSRSAMRFFNSRIVWESLHPVGADNYLFITSEQFDDESPRLYTLHEYTPPVAGLTDFDIRDIGGFQAFKTKEQALIALGKALFEEEQASGIEQRWNA